MATMKAFAGKEPAVRGPVEDQKCRIFESISRLSDWLERNDYQGYDTFDGLNAKLLRPLTFETKYLRITLQQAVRRFPINLRPLLGIKKSHSSKGMGFLAKGFMRMHEATGDAVWNEKAKYALQWLIDNPAVGYTGFSWGNHFDYQSRSSYSPKGLPSVVWTALIGHAFLDAHTHFGDDEYLRVAIGACDHLLADLSTYSEGDTLCITYFPGKDEQVHNANVLGASLLARTYALTGRDAYLTLAEKSIRYTTSHQRADASWYYGEAQNLHWVDNFHTAYVLDALKYYADTTQDRRFDDQRTSGYKYWKETFFLPDGTPRYYDRKTLPLDIQCASQAIDTLVFFHKSDPEAIPLALRVADWTIQHMQDRTGYFYYRRYSGGIVNKTPTLHWGQATMLCALAGLYKVM